mgnify:CR=1 FL=1
MDKEVIAWKNKGQKIDINGHQVFYIKEGSGPNLLILHGYPFNTFEWKFVWENLVKEYTVFTFDYLGMGFSEKPNDHDYISLDYKVKLKVVKLIKDSKLKVQSSIMGDHVRVTGKKIDDFNINLSSFIVSTNCNITYC